MQELPFRSRSRFQAVDRYRKIRVRSKKETDANHDAGRTRTTYEDISLKPLRSAGLYASLLGVVLGPWGHRGPGYA